MAKVKKISRKRRKPKELTKEEMREAALKVVKIKEYLCNQHKIKNLTEVKTMRITCYTCKKRRKHAMGAEQAIYITGRFSGTIKFRSDELICQQCADELIDTLLITLQTTNNTQRMAN